MKNPKLLWWDSGRQFLVTYSWHPEESFYLPEKPKAALVRGWLGGHQFAGTQKNILIYQKDIPRVQTQRQLIQV